MRAEQEAVIIEPNSSHKTTASTSKTDSEVSARRKALLLSRQLGLASEGEYRPSQVSLAQRAECRQQKLQLQFQANVEAIYNLAIQYTPSDVVGADPDPDWLYHFFDLAEKIHNRRMQDLWARILAREFTHPGNFSLRTLKLLCRLTWREAQTLEKALSMAIRTGNDDRLKLLSGYRIAGGVGRYFRKSPSVSLPLSQWGLPYSALVMLMDAGLLHSSEFETGELDPKRSFSLTLPRVELSLKPRQAHLILTYYRLSPVGDELAQLVRPQADPGFVQLLSSFLEKDFKVGQG